MVLENKLLSTDEEEITLQLDDGMGLDIKFLSIGNEETLQLDGRMVLEIKLVSSKSDEDTLQLDSGMVFDIKLLS